MQYLQRIIPFFKTATGFLLTYSIISLICSPVIAQVIPQIGNREWGMGNGETQEEEIYFSPSSPTTPIEPSPLAQLNSVDALSDVKPTDWAYQVLKSLMERYGVISGYPDGTFRPNRPVSRFEYAAALAATLDKIESLVADAIGDEFIQRDMIVVRRLTRDYRADLDEVRKRIDTAQARIAQMEADQFSTTTKLQGQIISALTDGSGANITVVNRARLNLLTSFNQKDLLVTQLEAGNNGGDAVLSSVSANTNSLTNTGFIPNSGLDYAGVEDSLKLRRLHYTFSPARDFAVTVGAKMSPRDFIDRNSYANNEALDFSSSVFLNNPLIVQNQVDKTGGAGIAVAWTPKNSQFRASSLYIAANANQPNSNSNNGLFGEPRQASLELEYLPSDKLTLKLQYTNAKVNNTDINAFGVNAEYALNKNAGIFGRMGIGSYQGFNTAINRDLDLHPISWMVGLGWRNILIPETLAGVAIGQPFIAGGLGNATQTNLEAFYNLKLNDNFSVTPTFSLVFNPNNNTANGTIWQSTLRTVFSF